VVSDDNDGLLVAPGDVPALTQALRRVIADPGLRIRLGNSARETVRRLYDVTATAAAYEALYRAALGMPAAAQACGALRRGERH
jgi:glycosyltransferase involved in cell wall biosynthesis